MNWIIYVALALVIPSALFGSYKFGAAHAERDAVTQCQQKSLNQLTSVISTTEQLINDAQQASLSLNKTISDRAVADQRTTSEIRRALTSTAHLRVECVVPDSVMQQLSGARDRANQAAASGINRPVPAAAATDR